MKKIRAYFVAGLVLLAPAFLTVLFIGYLVRLTDHFVVNPVFRALPLAGVDVESKIILAKVAIMQFVILFVTCLGYAAQKFLFKKILESGEVVLLNIPVFNKVYLSFKEISQALFGDKSGIFKRVVFIEYPRKGLYALGFVTQERTWEISEKTQKHLVSVFLPHPPNPATGYFVFVPKEELIEVNTTVEEGLRLVISAGAAIPSSRK